MEGGGGGVQRKCERKRRGRDGECVKQQLKKREEIETGSVRDKKRDEERVGGESVEVRRSERWIREERESASVL